MYYILNCPSTLQHPATYETLQITQKHGISPNGGNKQSDLSTAATFPGEHQQSANRLEMLCNFFITLKLLVAAVTDNS